jgi:hypothetical protein
MKMMPAASSARSIRANVCAVPKIVSVAASIRLMVAIPHPD